MALSWLLSLLRRADPPPALPAGRQDTASGEIVVRRDNWVNPQSGAGIVGRDPVLAAFFQTGALSDEEAIALERGDPIAWKVINKPINQALRPGFDLVITESDDGRDAKGKQTGTDIRPALDLRRNVLARWKALRVAKLIKKAWRLARREGGSAILMGSPDADDMRKPLGVGTLKPDLRWLRVIRARDLYPHSYYTDFKSDKFDEPEIWAVNAISKNGTGAGLSHQLVHESRLIIFPGEEVTDEAYQGQPHPGFGDSVLLRFYRVLRRYGMANGGVEALLAKFGEPVLHVEDLGDALAKDPEGVKATIAATEYIASVYNVRLVDSKDEYTRQTPTVTGVAELLMNIARELAAAADMPITELFGDVVGGLNATGAGPRQSWYDHVAWLRDEHATPALTRITEVIMLGLGGLPDDWEVVGKPLYQATAKEQAEVAKIEADIDEVYLNRSVVTPVQVMKRDAVAKRYAIDLSEIDDLEDARERMPDDVRTVGAGGDPEDDDEPDDEPDDEDETDDGKD
jgi:phage-related protein (TIGR01555 family)